MSTTEVEPALALLAQAFPEPRCPLFYTNAYTLLIAVLLSAQCTDAAVNKVAPALFTVADTPEKMLALGLDFLQNHLKSIGLYRRKAFHIMALSQRLLDKYGGCVPDNSAQLESLPGVGRKTACVVLNVIFGHPTMAVDTHVMRVAGRLGWTTHLSPKGVEKDLETLIPPLWKNRLSMLLIYHGRAVCKARSPLCHSCCLRPLCPSAPSQPGAPELKTEQFF